MSASQVDAFHSWMREKFRNVTGNNYTVEPGSVDHTYNCIAYAINLTTQKLLPSGWTELTRMYAFYGYYPVDNKTPLADGDVEVYAKGSDWPLHAHRVIDASTQECRSKMGDDHVISHHRDLLQCTHRNSNVSEYGVVKRRYRYDHERHVADQSKIRKTKSGREIKARDAAITSSGSFIRQKDYDRTQSGRVQKKSGKSSHSQGSSSKTGASSTSQGHSWLTRSNIDTTSWTIWDSSKNKHRSVYYSERRGMYYIEKQSGTKEYF